MELLNYINSEGFAYIAKDQSIKDFARKLSDGYKINPEQDFELYQQKIISALGIPEELFQFESAPRNLLTRYTPTM